jgi:GH25 family lysozyme M1 (1,4-beta-N-acetylmuramidase)
MGNIADLSRYQGTIDFARLAKVVDGVILRVQHGYTIPDERYKEYVAGCKANNIMFGTYAYFAGISINDAIAEADSAFDRMDKDSKFFVVDIEEKSMSDLVRGGQAFIDRLKTKGVKFVGLYSGENFYNVNGLKNIRSDFQWIAKYGVNDGKPHTEPPMAEDDLWQYTSTGRVDGITGNVDLNIVTNHAEFPFFDKNTTVVIPQETNDTKYPVKPVSTGNPIVAKVEVIADSLNCRQHPDVNSPILFVAKKGQVYNVTANINDWHEVIIDNDGHNGYLFGNNGTYLSLVRGNQQPAPVVQPVYHVVVSGDNLTKIARDNGVSISQIQTWNGISNPNLIKVGQRIRVK